MRKYLAPLALLGFLAVVTPAAVQAQTIGFKLGNNWAKVDVDEPDADGIDWASEFAGGGFIRFGLGGLALQVDVLAITKGAETSDPTEGDLEFEIEYVEVPVQLAFSLGSSRLSPYVLIGPSFGFEIGCQLEDETTGEDNEIDCDDADFFDRKSVDIGATGAAGIQFPLGPGSLLVEGRYTHGISNIADEGNTEIKNRSFGAYLGYAIRL